MRLEQIKEIANAVLYEGYLLYPYRHSAIKNRTRWTFGVVYPREYSEAHGATEPWTMQTECLVEGSEETRIDVTVRFLHLLRRSVEPANGSHQQESVVIQGAVASAGEQGPAGRWTPQAWEEGIEREVSAARLSLGELLAHPRQVEITLPGARLVEPPADATAGQVVREQQPLAGVVTIAAEAAERSVSKLHVQIENSTPGVSQVLNRHDAILLHSFVSTHTILQVRQGAFISLLEPPEALQALAQRCYNQGAWPVLVGDTGQRDTMLSSPIILYDYPQIAPESPGALFDGTEIDELLTLRIMTLTDAEKAEMRQGDERTRALLERTESLSPDQLMQLHGTIRSLRSVDTGGEA